MVLVITGMDSTADMVIDVLNERKIPVARFDLADFPMSLEFTATYSGAGFDGRLTTSSRSVDLTRVRAAYYRRPSEPAYPNLNRADGQFAKSQACYGFGGVLESLPGCRYVNHPRRSQAAEWKTAQLRVAGSLGFDVPPTIISNDPQAITDFVKAHGRCVYKSIVFIPHLVGNVAHVPWVRDVDAADLDQCLSATAHLFQKRIDKTGDVRATMVGDRMFSVLIESPHLDWRERYEDITAYRVVETPADIALKCRAYLDRFGLIYGCFDFGVDRDGRWWWYECNPSGEWGWIQGETGLPISTAFADILMKGHDV